MQTKTTAVHAANAVDKAEVLGRAAEAYRKRIGEGDITPEFVQQVEEAFADAHTTALLARSEVPPGARLTGKGRRSYSKGPRDAKDAAYRLVALILGNPNPRPTDSKEKIYAGLLAYDGRTEKDAKDSREGNVSEGTVNTFAKIRDWGKEEWDTYERNMLARMAGAEVSAVASEECGDCRRFKALAARKGWASKRCRPCQQTRDKKAHALWEERAARRLLRVDTSGALA